ncbi:uncharacterized protein isoform X1 [Rhodnius prolixus]|uniref:uncharacterized protein isoform X1 n=1 Tax=Rhodnius prolixus TaxID=13249 RepID=UPI003D18ACF7
MERRKKKEAVYSETADEETEEVKSSSNESESASDEDYTTSLDTDEEESGTSRRSESEDSESGYDYYKLRVNEKLLPKKYESKKSVKTNRKYLKNNLEIQRLRTSGVLTKDEEIFLECVHFKHFMVDSLLLQKLTNLNSDLTHKLIYCTVLKEMPFVDETEEPEKKKDKLNEEMCAKLFDLLYESLSSYIGRMTDLFSYLLLQLNDRTNFTINQKDIIFMTKSQKNKKRMKKKNLKPRKSITQNEKSESKTINEKSAENSNSPVNIINEKEMEILNDFRHFLNTHGVNGVKILGKLISSNVCNVLSGANLGCTRSYLSYLLFKGLFCIYIKNCLNFLQPSDDFTPT